MALFKALDQKWHKIHAENDNKEIIKRHEYEDISHHILANLLQDNLALSSLFHLCSFSLVSSHNNSFYSKEANFANVLFKDVMWENFVPIWRANAAKNL
ncbi:hypothetical protein ACH5RR_029684 [Cinchona calisaya]|uniref:RNase H type-1 domain-containing protein n=1 Tax=Cinchona calisaya TaxID=153742 RepID=A0ABD2YSG9_9GENT